MNLTDLGWSTAFAADFEAHRAQALHPARVARVDKLAYTLLGEHGPYNAVVSGRLRHTAASPADLPAVGDWVAIEPRPAERSATIHAVLPRRSAFVRKAAGTGGDEQVAAANVDSLLLVTGLDGDFNPRRIERYLTVAWSSGASPVIVLNKADVCPDLERRLGEIEALALATPVHAISATTGSGVDALRAYLRRGRTVALLGSSGVGKSTLINALLGAETQRTQQVRADDSRGRHTTTHRELFVLPEGGMIIDTPGMRELQLPSGDDGGLSSSFADIEELSERCRFSDCGHNQEPGCAIRAALDDGTLDAARLTSYRKLQRELHHAAIRNDVRAQADEKAKRRKLHKAYRQRTRMQQRWRSG